MTRCLGWTLSAGLCMALSACKSPQMDMSKMGPPPRPSQLDRLQPLVGTWESTATMKMGDQEMTSAGTSTAAWEADQRILVERFEGSMGESKFAGVGVWTWDANKGRFRNYWFDNMGGIGVGTARFDEGENLWRMSGKSTGPMGNTVGEGTMKLTDNNTMEWTYTEWDSLKLSKMFEMKGTSKRVR